MKSKKERRRTFKELLIHWSKCNVLKGVILFVAFSLNSLYFCGCSPDCHSIRGYFSPGFLYDFVNASLFFICTCVVFWHEDEDVDECGVIWPKLILVFFHSFCELCVCVLLTWLTIQHRWYIIPFFGEVDSTPCFLAITLSLLFKFYYAIITCKLVIDNFCIYTSSEREIKKIKKKKNLKKNNKKLDDIVEEDEDFTSNIVMVQFVLCCFIKFIALSSLMYINTLFLHRCNPDKLINLGYFSSGPIIDILEMFLFLMCLLGFGFIDSYMQLLVCVLSELCFYIYSASRVIPTNHFVLAGVGEINPVFAIFLICLSLLFNLYFVGLIMVILWNEYIGSRFNHQQKDEEVGEDIPSKGFFCCYRLPCSSSSYSSLSKSMKGLDIYGKI